ncbi:L-arabinitol 4-dehydrogenase [Coniosporium tulheliwenetii]|uniref:L-arabinitol 4-dehydrogenase n=1 Tax=Coniosporium tulheliwenetii TaxID=3383036 RepID=A0ACC2ZF41_9PEZI|nr:L-arabinitol 4-dehydrogenase [Cladosporium sp. JES 115]
MSSTITVTASKPNIGVFTNPEHDLWVADAEPSLDSVRDGTDLKPGEVTIAIKSTGICGSDIHFWHAGAIGPMVVTGSHILGHESSGQILSVHPSVSSLQPGDRVAIEAQHPLPRLRSLPHRPLQWLPFRRFPLHTARPRAATASGVELGEPVLVCGAGPIGLVTLLCCRAAGACPVVVTDIDEGRLGFARELVKGVKTFKVEAGQSAEAFAEGIVELMGGVEPSVAMECTGVESSVAGAIQAHPRGGSAVSVSVCEYVAEGDTAGEWGVIDLKKLVTHRFGLEEAVEAFKTAADPKTGAIKVQIQTHPFLPTLDGNCTFNVLVCADADSDSDSAVPIEWGDSDAKEIKNVDKVTLVSYKYEFWQLIYRLSPTNIDIGDRLEQSDDFNELRIDLLCKERVFMHRSLVDPDREYPERLVMLVEQLDFGFMVDDNYMMIMKPFEEGWNSLKQQVHSE